MFGWTFRPTTSWYSRGGKKCFSLVLKDIVVLIAVHPNCQIVHQFTPSGPSHARSPRRYRQSFKLFFTGTGSPFPVHTGSRSRPRGPFRQSVPCRKSLIMNRLSYRLRLFVPAVNPPRAWPGPWGSATHVSLFGQHGLGSQLGTKEYSVERRLRQTLVGWITQVKAFWPNCLTEISGDGRVLIVRSYKECPADTAKRRSIFDNGP